MSFKTTVFLNSKKAGNGISENFSIYYSPPIQLDIDKQYEVGLDNAYLWYSWYNISDSLNNNRFKYYNGKAWTVFTLPNGSYKIDDLNIKIKRLIDRMEKTEDAEEKASDNILLRANYNTLKEEIVIKGGYKVDFRALDSGNLHLLLGFKPERLGKNGTYSGDFPVNITHVNAVYIHCSLVESSYENSERSAVIYSFSPSVAPGYQISIKPNSINYLLISRISNISVIRMRITDQNGIDLPLNNEAVTYALRIREMRV